MPAISQNGSAKPAPKSAPSSKRPVVNQRDVPGPRGVVRSLYLMNSHPLEFLADISERYGDIVKFRLGFQTVILFNHPDAIEELVIARKDLLIKDWLTREIGVVLR